MFSYRKAKQDIFFSPCETTDFSDIRGMCVVSTDRDNAAGSLSQTNVAGKIGQCYNLRSSLSAESSLIESCSKTISSIASYGSCSAGIFAKTSYSAPTAKGFWVNTQYAIVVPNELSIAEIAIGSFLVRIQARRWVSNATSSGPGYAFTFTYSTDNVIQVLRDAFYINDNIYGEVVYSGSYSTNVWRFLGVEKSGRSLSLRIDGNSYSQNLSGAASIAIRLRTKSQVLRSGTFTGNLEGVGIISVSSNSFIDCINAFGDSGLVNMLYNSGNGVEL